MSDIMDRINEAARNQIHRENEWIEARLRNGENRIDYISASGHRIVIEVPRWRERPFRRLRIEWLRRRGPA